MQTITARKFLRRQLGAPVWLTYGTAENEITGYPLAVHKDYVEIQHADNGEIQQVPLWSIVEMVEVEA